MKLSVWHFAVLASLLVEVVDCNIRCYVCNTQGGLYADQCGDDFRLTSIATSICSGSCLKTRGYRNEGGRKVVEVTRGCVTYTEERCYEGDHNGISADICTCSEELCNSGPSLIITRWTGFVIGLCSILIKLTMSY